jgi:cephalosporin hydroxylase
MKITVENDNEKRTVDLYSTEGLDLISNLWVKLCAQYKLMYETTWMGIPIIQLPEDIVIMQELIWKIRPDVIIECGLAHGGSALFYASLLELIGKGFVIGIDVEIRHYNRIAIQNHPMSHRVKMIERSSISEETISIVKDMLKSTTKVMVVLDSNHSKEHVAKELDLYKEFVTPGSYMVAMDGAQAHVWDIPRGKTEWKEDNPLIAIEEFVKHNNDFIIDERCNRLMVSSNPKGYLRRITDEELERR